MTTKAQLHFCVCLIGHTDLHNLRTASDIHHSAQLLLPCRARIETRKSDKDILLTYQGLGVSSQSNHSQSEQHGFLL
jgi:hypothetical protein